MITATTPTERAVVAIDGLASDYLDLASRVMTTRAIIYRDRVTTGEFRAKRAPVNLDAVEKMEAVEVFAAEAAAAGREALRISVSRFTRKTLMQRTTARLQWLSDALPAIDANDTAIASQIAGQAWRTIRRLGADATAGGRAFRLNVDCPACGMESLWVDPASWKVACGMPECSAVWHAEGWLVATKNHVYD